MRRVPGPHHRRVRFSSTSPFIKKTKTSAAVHRLYSDPANMAAVSASASHSNPASVVPPRYIRPIPLHDALKTATSDAEDATVAACLPLLRGEGPGQRGFNAFGVPELCRNAHVAFCFDALEDYPAPFVTVDASRPWMICWALTGLSLLDEDVTFLRRRYVYHKLCCYLFSG